LLRRRPRSVETDASWPSARAREQDVVQYYQYSAALGNANAAAAVGRLLHHGAKGMTRDHKAAFRYFAQAAAAGDADATAHLGHMHANGVGVRPCNETAMSLFKKAAEDGSAHARYGLGYMHLAGFGVERDVKKAAQYLTQAGEQGSSDANFLLGAMRARGVGGEKDAAKAVASFSVAAARGHVPATYNLAMMQLAGIGISPSCDAATTLLKSIAEKGPWVKDIENAHALYTKKNRRAALLLYSKAADLGIEAAMANAAHVLERAGEWYEEAGFDPETRLERALHYHRLAADQGNVRSLLRIGDAYWYGRGAKRDAKKAAAVYQQASAHRSAQAMFNLGSMHETGVGLPKDLHLAKRYYDMVLTTDPHAWAPAKMALWRLALRVAIEARGEKIDEIVGVLRRNKDLVVAGILLCALACVLTLRVAMGVATTRDRRERAGASAREAAAAGRDARLAPVVAPAE